MRSGNRAIGLDIGADVDFGDCVHAVAPVAAPSRTKGLLRRSSPNVDAGPCPGTKVISSPSGQSFSRIERMSSA